MSDLGDSNWRIDSDGDLVSRGDRPISPARLFSGAIINVAQYTDFQAAFADLTDGDTLYLPPGEYPIQDWGTFTPPVDTVYRVAGTPSDRFESGGSVITNEGSGALSSGPLVDIASDSANRDVSDRVIEGITVRSDTGATGISATDAEAHVFKHCKYYNTSGSNEGETGIQTTGDSFSTAFYECVANTTGSGTPLHLKGSGQTRKVVGGGYTGAGATSDDYVIINDATETHFRDVNTGGKYGIWLRGDREVVSGVHFENDEVGIRFGDSAGGTTCFRAEVERPAFSTQATSMAVWEDSDDCRLSNPVAVDGSGTDPWHFTADAYMPHLDVDQTGAGVPLTDNGATAPTVEFDFAVQNSTERGNLSAQVPGTKHYYTFDSTWYEWDGSSWVSL